MTNRVYKGQGLVLEGNYVGENFIVTKTSRTPALQYEYIGEAKYGTPDNMNRHYIMHVTYTPALQADRILSASNDTTTDATNVTVETLVDKRGIRITIVNGDFSEVHAGDEFTLNTTNNHMRSVPITAVLSDTQILVSRLENLDIPIVDETNTPINKHDLLIRLKHEDTMEFHRRRWDHRTRYIYV
jgi:hypothetical protein